MNEYLRILVAFCLKIYYDIANRVNIFDQMLAWFAGASKGISLFQKVLRLLMVLLEGSLEESRSIFSFWSYLSFVISSNTRETRLMVRFFRNPLSLLNFPFSFLVCLIQVFF